MTNLKPVACALIGLAVAIGGSSVAWAKAHDQGVADGTRVDPSTRAGLVDDLVKKGGGAGTEFENDPDFRYGQDIVSPKGGDNRVNPVDRPGQNKPPRA